MQPKISDSDRRNAETTAQVLRANVEAIDAAPIAQERRAACRAVLAKPLADIEASFALIDGTRPPAVVAAEKTWAQFEDEERAFRERKRVARAELEAARAAAASVALPLPSATANGQRTLMALRSAIDLVRALDQILDRSGHPDNARSDATAQAAKQADRVTLGPIYNDGQTFKSSDVTLAETSLWPLAEYVALRDAKHPSELAAVLRARAATVSARLAKALEAEGRAAEARAAEAVERRAVELFGQEQEKLRTKARAAAEKELLRAQP